eukprot:2679102-Rhodomonas_salina.5
MFAAERHGIVGRGYQVASEIKCNNNTSWYKLYENVFDSAQRSCLCARYAKPGTDVERAGTSGSAATASRYAPTP